MSSDRRAHPAILRVPRAAAGARRLAATAASSSALAGQIARRTQPPGAARFGPSLLRRMHISAAPGIWAAQVAQRFASAERALPAIDLPFIYRWPVRRALGSYWPSATPPGALAPGYLDAPAEDAPPLDLEGAGWVWETRPASAAQTPVPAAGHTPRARPSSSAPPPRPDTGSGAPAIGDRHAHGAVDATAASGEAEPVRRTEGEPAEQTRAEPALPAAAGQIASAPPAAHDSPAVPADLAGASSDAPGGSPAAVSDAFQAAPASFATQPLNLAVQRSAGLLRPLSDPLRRMGLVARAAVQLAQGTPVARHAATIARVPADSPRTQAPQTEMPGATAVSRSATPVAPPQSRTDVARAPQPSLSEAIARRYAPSSTSSAAAAPGSTAASSATSWQAPASSPAAPAAAPDHPVLRATAAEDTAAAPQDSQRAPGHTPLLDRLAGGAEAPLIDREADESPPAAVAQTPTPAEPGAQRAPGSTATGTPLLAVDAPASSGWSRLPLAGRVLSRQTLALSAGWAPLSRAAERGPLQRVPWPELNPPQIGLPSAPQLPSSMPDVPEVPTELPAASGYQPPELPLPSFQGAAPFGAPPGVSLPGTPGLGLPGMGPAQMALGALGGLDQAAASSAYGAALPQLDLALPGRGAGALGGGLQGALNDLPTPSGLMAAAGEAASSAMGAASAEGAAAGTSAGPSIDELARKVYDHLRDRLWIEIERRGRGTW